MLEQIPAMGLKNSTIYSILGVFKVALAIRRSKSSTNQIGIIRKSDGMLNVAIAILEVTSGFRFLCLLVEMDHPARCFTIFAVETSIGIGGLGCTIVAGYRQELYTSSSRTKL